MNNKLKSIIHRIYRPFFVLWNNFRWSNVKAIFKANPNWVAEDDKMNEDEKVKVYAQRMAGKIMKAFTYKPDGIEELGDSIAPPPYLYNLYKQSQSTDGQVEFADDCDGFHGALTHLLTQAGYNAKLLSILSLNNKWGHAVCLYYDYKNDHKWHIQDYYTNHEDEDLEKLVAENYSTVTDGAYMLFQMKYNYETLRWESVPAEKYAYFPEDILAITKEGV